MPNHFHFLVRMKEEETLQSANRQFQLDREVPEPSIMPIDNEAYSDFLSKIFSNLLNSYAQAFNKQQKRRGSLFLKPFKRRKVDSMQYFKNAVHYIHPNPVAHGFSDSIWSNGSILLIKHGVLTRLQS
jgi:REP element-mobilizing transposase RayT